MREEAKPIDRTGWGSGPWDNEPDRIEFECEGFPCLMRRTHNGNWCGYVAVSPTHPAFEKSYQDIEVDVHGGLTYSDHCRDEICHVPKPGEPDNVWWFGFDCAHGGDWIPSFNKYEFQMSWEKYRDISYVKSEIEDLAKQLKAMEGIHAT